MKKVAIFSIGALVLAGVAFSALGGMAWLDANGLRGQKRLVQSRIEGYWQARVDGDIERVARYVHPGQTSVPDPGMLVTEGYEIDELEVEGDEAVAKVTVRSRLKHPILSARDRTISLDNRWVRYDGQWYLEVKPVGYHEMIQNHMGQWNPPTATATPES